MYCTLRYILVHILVQLEYLYVLVGFHLMLSALVSKLPFVRIELLISCFICEFTLYKFFHVIIPFFLYYYSSKRVLLIYIYIVPRILITLNRNIIWWNRGATEFL